MRGRRGGEREVRGGRRGGGKRGKRVRGTGERKESEFGEGEGKERGEESLRMGRDVCYYVLVLLGPHGLTALKDSRKSQGRLREQVSRLRLSSQWTFSRSPTPGLAQPSLRYENRRLKQARGKLEHSR